jgi:hypothetical protein
VVVVVVMCKGRGMGESSESLAGLGTQPPLRLLMAHAIAVCLFDRRDGGVGVGSTGDMLHCVVAVGVHFLSRSCMAASISSDRLLRASILTSFPLPVASCHVVCRVSCVVCCVL